MRIPRARRRPDVVTTYGSSRHAAVSRRAAIRYGAALGAGAVLAACADDAELLRDASIDIQPDTTVGAASNPISAPAPATASPGSTVPDTVPPETVPPDTVPPETVPPETVPPETAAPDTAAAEIATATTAVPVGGQLLVSFTYQHGPVGKNRSPYTAVWIEDAGGDLVHTIALWMDQGRQGQKWLRDLRQWFSADQAAGGVDVVSSATRVPGEYTVTWDGLAGGAPAPAGEYFVCIEAAREDGPTSLVRQAITLTGQPVDQTLAPDGELVAASVVVA